MQGDSITRAVQMRRQAVTQKIDEKKRHGVIGDPMPMPEDEADVYQSLSEVKHEMEANAAKHSAAAQASASEPEYEPYEHGQASAAQADQPAQEPIYMNVGGPAFRNNPQVDELYAKVNKGARPKVEAFPQDEGLYEDVASLNIGRNAPLTTEQKEQVEAQKLVDVFPSDVNAYSDMDYTSFRHHTLKIHEGFKKNIHETISNASLPTLNKPEIYDAMCGDSQYLLVKDENTNDAVYLDTLLKSGKFGICSTQNDYNLDEIFKRMGVGTHNAMRVWAAHPSQGKHLYLDHFQRCTGNTDMSVLIDDSEFSKVSNDEKTTRVIIAGKAGEEPVLKADIVKGFENVVMIKIPKTGGLRGLLSEHPEALQLMKETISELNKEYKRDHKESITKRHEQEVASEQKMDYWDGKLYKDFIESGLRGGSTTVISSGKIRKLKDIVLDRTEAQTFTGKCRRDDITFQPGGRYRPIMSEIKADPSFKIPTFEERSRSQASRGGAGFAR